MDEKYIKFLNDGPVPVSEAALSYYLEKHGDNTSFDRRYYAWINRRQPETPEGYFRLIIRDLIRQDFDLKNQMKKWAVFSYDNLGRFLHIGGGKKEDQFRYQLENRPELYDEFMSEFLHACNTGAISLCSTSSYRFEQAYYPNDTVRLFELLLRIADPVDAEKLGKAFIALSELENPDMHRAVIVGMALLEKDLPRGVMNRAKKALLANLETEVIALMNKEIVCNCETDRKPEWCQTIENWLIGAESKEINLITLKAIDRMIVKHGCSCYIHAENTLKNLLVAVLLRGDVQLAKSIARNNVASFGRSVCASGLSEGDITTYFLVRGLLDEDPPAEGFKRWTQSFMRSMEYCK
ncbi:MAG: hypothetical protein LBG75_02915 [Candidatus Nomurabacteria bacterium]|jgi:hypothetical protein|nr:hypothetical protein [Candidatus Nomurabacteria bacterium]